jgi:hypothetical protein
MAFWNNKEKPVEQKKKKSTKVEIENREYLVYRMLLSGMTRMEIMQNDAVKAWGLEERQIDNYIAAAKEQIAAIAIPKREEFMKDAIAKLDDLYRLNIANELTNECRLCISTKNKILGFENTTLTHAGSIELVTTTTPEQRQKEIDELLKKRNAG